MGLAAEGRDSVFDLAVADRPVMLVLGAEGRGLAPAHAASAATCSSSIPMPGAVDSLNVATAAAVACFEVVRRRGTAEPEPVRVALRRRRVSSVGRALDL